MRRKRKPRGFFEEVVRDAKRAVAGTVILIGMIVLMVTSLIVGITSSRLSKLPDIEVSALCEIRSDADLGIYNACVEAQQAAHDALEPKWATLPKDTRAWCREHAHAAGGYESLAACVKGGHDGLRIFEDGDAEFRSGLFP